jgi:iron complex transport system substrate-binding protein
MPAFALLLGASSAARIASLNLCTDEYAILLANPQQVVSVSYLSQDPLESPLWRSARRYRANRGSLEDVLTLRPTLVLTMGGGGHATRMLAARLHIQALDVPYANSLDDVERNLRTVAAAFGDDERAKPWIAEIEKLRRTAPAKATDAIWVSGRGDTLAPGSLGDQWLRLAGFEQRLLSGGRVTLETLLTSPPKVLIRSNYRSSQMSGGTQWLEHPIVRHAGTRQIVTDGRRWTCMGPLMIPEIQRLRSLAR